MPKTTIELTIPITGVTEESPVPCLKCADREEARRIWRLYWLKDDKRYLLGVRRFDPKGDFALVRNWARAQSLKWLQDHPSETGGSWEVSQDIDLEDGTVNRLVEETIGCVLWQLHWLSKDGNRTLIAQQEFDPEGDPNLVRSWIRAQSTKWLRICPSFVQFKEIEFTGRWEMVREDSPHFFMGVSRDG